MIDDETVNRIIDLVERVGSSAAQEGFALATRYAFAQGVVHTILSTLGLIACIVGLYYGIRLIQFGYNTIKPTNVDGESRVLAGGLLSIVTIGLGAAALSGLAGGIMRLIVPEWYAVRALFGLVTGGS